MSSGFITESEALEARRLRQEEWEKVRTEDQPKEAPEEPYDNRPLYHRLEEQRMKKEAEYEETHKLKNMIRGLDDDEVGFLDLVEAAKAQAAQQISIEEQKEMREFRERVSNLAETEEMQRLRAQVASVPSARATPPASQKNKLQGVVVRKRKASELDSDIKDKETEATPAKLNGVTNKRAVPSSNVTPASEDIGALHCVGVLPGLGHYDTDTSSDSDSSEDEVETCAVKRDLCGRRAESTADTQEKSKEQAKS